MISEHKIKVHVEYNSVGTANILGTNFRKKPAISKYYIGKKPFSNGNKKIWVYHFYDYAEKEYWRIKCKDCLMWFEHPFDSPRAMCKNCILECQGIYDGERMWIGINEKRGIQTIDRRVVKE
jgi:hypothetical protein